MKPILFNTDMVRAIQAERKTVTRLVVKPQPPATTHVLQDGKHFWWSFWEDGPFDHVLQPPYRPGDILYVRETFWAIPDGSYSYKADAPTEYADKLAWHPSIHMPREAARIFLRVTDVRVERLRDITDADANREGFANRGAFIREFLTMYPDCTMETWLWVIAFERISREEATKDA